MFSTKTRTTIAVLAATLSVAVAAGPASAARSMDYTAGGGGYTFVPTTSVVAQEVAPTGNGPANEQDCHEWQDMINDKQDLLDASMAEDAGMGWDTSHQTEQLQGEVEEVEDAALSDGCFIIY
jgi:hypothetical protein